MRNIDGKKSWEMILKQLVVCRDTHEKSRLISEISNLETPRVLSFINAHAANLVWTNHEFRKNILSSDFLLRDGSGMHILMSSLNIDPGLDLNGTDLIPELLHSYNKSSVVAVYGTQEDFLKDGVSAIKKMGFKKTTHEHGFHPLEYYVENFKELKPNLVILAMGMPKQEKLSILLRDAATPTADVLIVNGGAIVDFLSGKVKRSPKYFQKMGIEWLYRLSREPKRLWKRNLGSILFLLRIVDLKISITKQNSIKKTKT